MERLESRCVMAGVLPSLADASTLTIAVLGDFGGASNYAAAGPKLAYTNSEKVVSDLVHSWTPDCVVTVGDNNYEGGAYATIDANIGQYYHDLIYPYPSAAFSKGGATSPFTGLNYNLYLQDNNGKHSTPMSGYGPGAADEMNHFFPVPGNHEYGTGNSYDPQAFVHAPDPAPYFDYFDFLTNSQYQPTTPGTAFPLTNGLLKDHQSGNVRPAAYYYTFSQGQAANGPLVQFFMLDSNPWPGSGLITTKDDGRTLITDAVTNQGQAIVPTADAKAAAIQSARSDQATWLRAALSESKAVFKIVAFHHAAYTSYDSGNKIPGDDAAYWMQWPFSSWGADAVLSGHKHSYERLAEKDPAFYSGLDLGYNALAPAIPYWAYGNGGAADNVGIPSIPGPAPGSAMQYSKDVGAMKITATGGSNPTMTLAFVSCMKQDTAKTHFIDPLTISPRLPPVAATAPVVRSIVPTSFNDRLGIVTYTVTFSAPVTGVDAGDFIISGRNSRIQRISGSGSTYVVTVRAGHGVGASHQLQLWDNDSIRSVNGNLALEGTIGADGSAAAVQVTKVRRASGFAAFAIAGRPRTYQSSLRSGLAG